MEISGKIIQVLPLKSGTSQRGEWQSQQYVLETQEQYPHKFLFEVYGADKINAFALQVGDVVQVSYHPDARPYKETWYGSNHAWKVERTTAVTTAP